MNNENNETAVMEQLDAVMLEDTTPEVMVISSEEPEEIMVLPDNINPKMVDELITIDPEEDDIADEIGQMETYQNYQRQIFAEMRGYTSDQF